MFEILLAGVLFISPQDSVLEKHYFSRCVNESISTDYFYLGGDSLILVIRWTHQYKSSVFNVGNWTFKDGILEWREHDSLSKYYKIDTISTLSFLLPIKANRDSVRIEVLKCLDRDPLPLEEYKSDRLALRRIEYFTIKNCFCESDVLIEFPDDLPPIDFSYFPPKNRKKKSKK